MNSSNMDIEQLLRAFNNLEMYCDAPDSSFYESTPSCSVDISLEEALHFPQRISTRVPTETNECRQLTLRNLKTMWCRDVAHYFEWVAGVPELRLMDVQEKVGSVNYEIAKEP
ncbi:hypothetical protein COOONC_23113, partial [Cooperia oncophora]